MMIVMKTEATPEEVRAVVERVESVGARAHVSQGEEVTVIGAVGDREHVQRLGLEGHAGVDQIIPILKPYKLASTEIAQGERTVLDIGGPRSGPPHLPAIARPGTLETPDPTLATPRAARAARAPPLPGGAEQ